MICPTWISGLSFANAARKRISEAGGNQWNVRPGPNGIEFTDIIGGFHNAPSGSVTAGKGTCAFVDGHVAAASRDDTFPLAWPLGSSD